METIELLMAWFGISLLLGPLIGRIIETPDEFEMIPSGTAAHSAGKQSSEAP